MPFVSKHEILAFLLFLTFLFTIFNNSPHSIYAKNCCLVSFDVIMVLREISDKQVL